MRLLIFSLLALLSLITLFSCVSAGVVVPRTSLRAKPTIEPKSDDAPVDPLQPVERQAKPMRFARSSKDEEAHEPAPPTNQLGRTARCAQWLRRTANRYIRPGGLSLLLNGGGSLLNLNLSDRPSILSNGDGEDRNWNEHLNYYLNRPETFHRENDGPPQSVYFVPSTSTVAPFVESHNFITPPNRVAPVSVSPPVETNEDWVGNAEPESPPARDPSASSPSAPVAPESAPAAPAASVPTNSENSSA